MVTKEQKISSHPGATTACSLGVIDISNLCRRRLHQRILGEITRIDTTLDSPTLKNINGDWASFSSCLINLDYPVLAPLGWLLFNPDRTVSFLAN
jgi:hypothetical protein